MTSEILCFLSRGYQLPITYLQKSLTFSLEHVILNNASLNLDRISLNLDRIKCP